MIARQLEDIGMHETDAARAVANPRRTRLGPDWTSQSTAATARPEPTPSPARDASAEEHPVG